MIEAVIALADAQRIAATLDRLAGAGLSDMTVTGGIAIAWHLGRATDRPAVRALNDLDLVVRDATALARVRFDGMLLVHLHFDALPGRLLVQAVDPVTGLRVDVFGASGGQLARDRPASFRGGELRVVSAGDLAARLASLLLDLGLGEPVPAKHARDFLALLGRVDASAAPSAWADHRRPRQPAAFEDARRAVLDLIRDRRDLLVETAAFDVTSPCPRCRPVAGLDLAPPAMIAAALGLR